MSKAFTYAPLLAELKARVRAVQVRAAVAVNREIILLCWHIWREIMRIQKTEGWGTKVVARLVQSLPKNLHSSLPTIEDIKWEQAKPRTRKSITK